jgi:tRNA/rRNA methyltransferase
MPYKVNLSNIAIILNQPKRSENIGAVARAVCNMGIGRLAVVKPRDYHLPDVLKMATHAAAEIVEQIEFYDDLRSALHSYGYIVGTTARLGGQRQVVTTPRKMAKELVPISLKNPVAILFGPEDRGLTNEDIRYCQVLVNIPTAEFSSLNLAQAVMVICYEIFAASLENKAVHIPRLANRDELEKMYDQLKEILVRISYINPENPDHWINGMRRFFNRLPLRSREVSIIRGICRQINWYGQKSFHDGLSHQQKTDQQTFKDPLPRKLK